MTAVLLGCDDGPADLTLVDDVRLVAVIAEPPEVAAGETYTLDVVVADPFDEGADVVIWQCGPPDLPCQVTETGLDDDTARATLIAGIPGPAWILACRPGVCEPPTEAQLRDPTVWLRDLPLVGVAAGTKTVALTDAAERRTNPVITTAPDREPVGAPDDSVPLRFVSPGIETASGLATAGGFAQVAEAVPSDGDFTLDWLTPSEAGSARIWVVLDDGLGGTAVWRGTATVQ